MNRLLFGLLLTMSMTCHAVEWRLLSPNSNGTSFYIDLETSEQDGNIRRLWIMENRTKSRMVEGKRILSAIVFKAYDCKVRRSQSLSGTYYSGRMGHGKVLYVFEEKEDAAQFDRIVPGTFAEQIINEVCLDSWLNPASKIKM